MLAPTENGRLKFGSAPTVLAAGNFPAHRTIRDFRAIHLDGAGATVRAEFATGARDGEKIPWRGWVNSIMSLPQVGGGGRLMVVRLA